MAGSNILDTVMYNIYGESTAPASVRTRAAKELYDCLIKVQKGREWWFSRATLALSYSAGVNAVDISSVTPHLDTIGLVYITKDSRKIFLTRIDLDFAEKQTFQSGTPQYFTEDVDKLHINFYPAPEDTGTGTLIYRKIFFPDTVTTIQAAIEAYADTVIDILQPYLEAIVTSRMCTVLDYADKATKYADAALTELDGIIKTNADYNRQGFSFMYNGV